MLTKYKNNFENLNYEGITFPVTNEQIPKIEEQIGISVFIHEYDDEEKLKYQGCRSKTQSENRIF